MTNLEKWVLSLKREDFINIISEMECHQCPARNYCGPFSGYADCKIVVREWASKEAKQNEEGDL